MQVWTVLALWWEPKVLQKNTSRSISTKTQRCCYGPPAPVSLKQSWVIFHLPARHTSWREWQLSDSVIKIKIPIYIGFSNCELHMYYHLFLLCWFSHLVEYPMKGRVMWTLMVHTDAAATLLIHLAFRRGSDTICWKKVFNLQKHFLKFSLKVTQPQLYHDTTFLVGTAVNCHYDFNILSLLIHLRL